MGSLVDPSYELVDPTPDVHALFCDFDRRFFDGRLAACEVKWSPRMTTCAGLCCYEVRSGLCQIKLSTPLLKLRPRSDLVETLLHEMIHAFLFVSVRDRDRDGHGPQFQWHMNRINKEAGTRITIYHSFHAEVAVYKQHHWRCSGPCRERRPFFGWVKRTTNRAPSKNDLWWADHERSCGGTYTKVAEPKEFTEKREKAERKKAEGGVTKRGGASAKVGGAKSPVTVDDPKKQPRIDAVFGGGGGTKLGTTAGAAAKPVSAGGGVGGGGGQMLGGVAGRSRLLDLMGGPGGKKSGTVGKENRSITVIDGDDDCVVIEQPPRPPMVRDRPRLRGGSQEDINLEESDNSRDGSDRAMDADDDEMHTELFFNNSDSNDAEGCPPAVPYHGEVGEMEKHLGDMENYLNGGGGGNIDEHNYGFINNSMPVLSPVHVQNQSQYDDEIARMERNIAKANVRLNDLMNEGRNDDVMPQFSKIEEMNKQLTWLQGKRDEEMAKRIHDEENEELSPDEKLARQLQREEDAKQKKSQLMVDDIYAKHSDERGQTIIVPQEKVEKREEDDRRRRRERRQRNWGEDDEKKDEERLKREQEEWEREERRRYPSRMNEPMITPPELRRGRGRLTAGGEGRGEGEEQREGSDEVRVTRRRGRGRGAGRARERRETRVEVDDDEDEQMMGREERRQVQQDEMVQEEVMMQRRHRQTFDMDIDQWMLLEHLPYEDEPPVYEDVGTLRITTRARPAARGNQNTRQRAAMAAAFSDAAAAAAESGEAVVQQPAAPQLALLLKRVGRGTRGGRQPMEKRPRGKKAGLDDELIDPAALAAIVADVDGGNKGGHEDELAASARVAAAAAAARRAQLGIGEAASMEGVVEEGGEPAGGGQSIEDSDDDWMSPMKRKTRG